MKTGFWGFAWLMLWLLMVASPVKGQTHRGKSDPCRDTSKMAQADLNDCAVKELRKAEVRLEALLKELRITQDSPEQKAWESYRDAQLAAIYPPEGVSDYGSVYPICLATLKKKLVEGRIRDLRALTTSGEGDVCSGYRASASTRKTGCLRVPS